MRPLGVTGHGKTPWRPSFRVTFGESGAEAATDAAAAGAAQALIALWQRTDPLHRDLFLEGASYALGPSRPLWVDQLLEVQPEEPLGWLLRGTHQTRIALACRGELTDDVAVEQYRRLLLAAEDNFQRAAELDQADHSPWSQLLVSGRALGIRRDELLRRFERASPTGSWLPYPHHQYLLSLSERSGGAPGDAPGFAQLVASVAPIDAPVHDLVVVAALEEAWMRRRRGRRISTTLAGVGEEISAAARRSVERRNFNDDGFGILARNVCALALGLIGEKERARRQIHRIGDRVTPYPWQFLGEPGDQFARFARRIGA